MKLSRLISLCLVIASPSIAQDDVFKLNVNVDLVELHVSVADELDRPVSGLKKEHFRILENQAEQPISVFKHEDLPISLGLVVDNSRSIEPRKERLDAAALAFVRKSNPEDETFVVHFDFDARVSRAFTSNISDLETTLSGIKPFGQTAVYDAVILALDHMVNAKHEKKALLLITDGIDNSSKHTLEEAVERLKRSRVAVYPVGLLSAAEGQEAELDLLKMAEASGGKAYFPENVEQARTMMEGVARDLREQYTLGYFSANRADGAWRSVRVEIQPPIGLPQKLKANYRHGYYGARHDSY